MPGRLELGLDGASEPKALKHQALKAGEAMVYAVPYVFNEHGHRLRVEVVDIDKDGQIERFGVPRRRAASHLSDQDDVSAVGAMQRQFGDWIEDRRQLNEPERSMDAFPLADMYDYGGADHVRVIGVQMGVASDGDLESMARGLSDQQLLVLRDETTGQVVNVYGKSALVDQHADALKQAPTAEDPIDPVLQAMQRLRANAAARSDQEVVAKFEKGEGDEPVVVGTLKLNDADPMHMRTLSEDWKHLQILAKDLGPGIEARAGEANQLAGRKAGVMPSKEEAKRMLDAHVLKYARNFGYASDLRDRARAKVLQPAVVKYLAGLDEAAVRLQRRDDGELPLMTRDEFEKNKKVLGTFKFQGANDQWVSVKTTSYDRFVDERLKMVYQQYLTAEQKRTGCASAALSEADFVKYVKQGYPMGDPSQSQQNPQALIDKYVTFACDDKAQHELLVTAKLQMAAWDRSEGGMPHDLERLVEAKRQALVNHLDDSVAGTLLRRKADTDLPGGEVDEYAREKYKEAAGNDLPRNVVWDADVLGVFGLDVATDAGRETKSTLTAIYEIMYRRAMIECEATKDDSRQEGVNSRADRLYKGFIQDHDNAVRGVQDDAENAAPASVAQVQAVRRQAKQDWQQGAGQKDFLKEQLTQQKGLLQEERVAKYVKPELVLYRAEVFEYFDAEAAFIERQHAICEMSDDDYGKRQEHQKMEQVVEDIKRLTAGMYFKDGQLCTADGSNFLEEFEKDNVSSWREGLMRMYDYVNPLNDEGAHHAVEAIIQMLKAFFALMLSILLSICTGQVWLPGQFDKAADKARVLDTGGEMRTKAERAVFAAADLKVDEEGNIPGELDFNKLKSYVDKRTGKTVEYPEHVQDLFAMAAVRHNLEIKAGTYDDGKLKALKKWKASANDADIMQSRQVMHEGKGNAVTRAANRAHIALNRSKVPKFLYKALTGKALEEAPNKQAAPTPKQGGRRTVVSRHARAHPQPGVQSADEQRKLHQAGKGETVDPPPAADNPSSDPLAGMRGMGRGHHHH